MEGVGAESLGRVKGDCEKLAFFMLFAIHPLIYQYMFGIKGKYGKVNNKNNTKKKMNLFTEAAQLDKFS